MRPPDPNSISRRTRLRSIARLSVVGRGGDAPPVGLECGLWGPNSSRIGGGAARLVRAPAVRYALGAPPTGQVPAGVAGSGSAAALPADTRTGVGSAFAAAGPTGLPAGRRLALSGATPPGRRRHGGRL